MNNKFNKAIEEIKKIKMTSEDKQSILENIIGDKRVNISSPWNIYSFGTWIQSHRIISSVLFAILIITFTGGELVYASQSSLPGDILYPVKINITEPVRIALVTSPIAKAKLLVNYASRRVTEGEILALQNKFDQAKQVVLSDLINKNTEALNTQLLVVAKSDPKIAQNISQNFEKAMNRHVDRLHFFAPININNTGSSTKIENIISTTSIKIINQNRSDHRSDNKDEDKNNNSRPLHIINIKPNIASSTRPSPVIQEVKMITSDSQSEPKPIEINSEAKIKNESISNFEASVRINVEKISLFNKHGTDGTNTEEKDEHMNAHNTNDIYKKNEHFRNIIKIK